jgi:hypothetical protein
VRDFAGSVGLVEAGMGWLPPAQTAKKRAQNLTPCDCPGESLVSLFESSPRRPGLRRVPCPVRFRCKQRNMLNGGWYRPAHPDDSPARQAISRFDGVLALKQTGPYHYQILATSLQHNKQVQSVALSAQRDTNQTFVRSSSGMAGSVVARPRPTGGFWREGSDSR